LEQLTAIELSGKTANPFDQAFRDGEPIET